jgi:tRNA pseudouridine55 synthase
MTSTPRTKVPRRPVHGVLLLDKPIGLSSNQALQRAKWLLRAEKAGHTGTLDPLATGALPLCFGAATKFSQLHLDADKAYEAVVCLGIQTDSGDAEGEITLRKEAKVDQSKIDQVVKGFLGAQMQTPPMYSALKKDGKALYEYARAGEVVERTPRSVTFYALSAQLLPELGPDGCPLLALSVRCSKGTYIRTLGEDIAIALGTVGHLVALRRIKTGPFDVVDAISLDTLEQMDEDSRAKALLPVDCLLGGFTPHTLASDEAGRFLSGLRRRVSQPDQERVAVYGQDPPALLGTAHLTGGELIPDRLLNPQEIEQMLNAQALPLALEK